MKKLNTNLNNAISEISSIMKSCDINFIGYVCLKIVENSDKLLLGIYLTKGEQLKIKNILISMKSENLNNKLSLSPKIFTAVDKIQK
jgi:hypothetical protein